MIFKEIFKDALPLIEKFAPTVFSVLIGPHGAGTTLLLPILYKAFKPIDWAYHSLDNLVKTIVEDENAPQKLAEIEKENCGWLCHLVNNSSAEIDMKIGFNVKDEHQSKKEQIHE